MSLKVTYKHKKQLEKDISTLSANEYNEILNIIRNNKQKYSENIGGIYFNLKYINNSTIQKIIEFVKFAKENKDTMEEKNKKDKKIEIENKVISNINKSLGKKYTLDKNSIQQELLRLKNKNKENFSFQNFLDKLSVSNIKTFKKNNDKIVYPELKQIKMNFSGSSERILKKCREVNKRDFYSYFSYNENVDDDAPEDEIDAINPKIQKFEKKLNKILCLGF